MLLMKLPKNFEKIAISKMWELVSFWGVKTHFGNLPLKWCIFRYEKKNAPVQNDWYSTKVIWTLQNNFGPIEGQGIRFDCIFLPITKRCDSLFFAKTTMFTSTANVRAFEIENALVGKPPFYERIWRRTVQKTLGSNLFWSSKK